MKKLIPLTLACSLLGVSMISMSYADETDYSTRTLRARHATTTGSPAYADRDMEERMEERDNNSSLILESDRETEYDGEEFDETRTYKARKALDTGDDY